MTDEQDIIAAAAQWHAASARDDMDWDGFTAWLEADPRHAAAYDEVARTDALLGAHRVALRGLLSEQAEEFQPTEAEEPDDETVVRPHWRRWAVAAVAAVLVAMLALPALLHTPGTIYRTGAAAQVIALADGSSVTLAPHSRLTVSAPDRMALRGGAFFDIRHDPHRALAISAGPVTVSDIGTRFDVQVNREGVRVAVADGKVRASSTLLSAPIELGRGSALTFDTSQRRAVVRQADSSAIGSWRGGRLTYSDTPLVLVAADLARYAGVRVEVPKALRDRRFSGTLVIGDGQTALRDLSQLMGLELDRAGAGYRLAVPAG